MSQGVTRETPLGAQFTRRVVFLVPYPHVGTTQAVPLPLASPMPQPTDLLHGIISGQAEKARRERDGKTHLVWGRSSTPCSLPSTFTPPQNCSDTAVEGEQTEPAPAG